jgi:hypothetical protein
MAIIYKYQLKITDVQVIEMPQVLKFLHVDIQNDQPCLWVWIDLETELESRTIRIFGTGHITPSITEVAHLGTFKMLDDKLIWHVFVDIA